MMDPKMDTIAQNHVNEENEYWNEYDIDSRNELLDNTFHPNKCIPPLIPPSHSPEISNLICLPQDQIRTKLGSFLSSINLISSLLLAGIIETGLNPPDCTFKELEDNEEEISSWMSVKHNHRNQMEHLCNINNYLSIFMITINVSIILFTSYILTQLEVESADNILR